MATAYTNRVEAAMRKAKRHFENECIISATQPVDAAHIFPRSTHPHLSYVPQNIVPLSRRLHHVMDQFPRAADRITFLRQHVNPEHRPQLEAWLIDLLQVIAEAA
jgi:5-methylcytosine-specific restriction endonuclease McrA